MQNEYESTDIIRIEHLNKTFGDVKAVRDLGFCVKRACEKTRVFSFVLLLIVIIIAILHKKGYSSPYPIRMIL